VIPVVRIRNKHSLRPIDVLPPPPPPPRRGAPVPPPSESDESLEAVRALLRRAEAELQLGGRGGDDGDVADGMCIRCLVCFSGMNHSRLTERVMRNRRRSYRRRGYRFG
jgi:hypothetical protein